MDSEDWQEFNYSNYRSIPDLPGIYCWRYKPRIELGQVKKLYAQLASETDVSMRARILHDSIEGQLLKPFYRPDYSVAVQGPLLPKYIGSISHKLPDFSGRLESLAQDLDRLPSFINYINKLYDMVSMPFYIGIASEQTVNRRVKSHVLAITRYKSQGRFDDLSDSESINLASRIVERQINPIFLWISCLVCDNDACIPNLSDLEFILNRTINPVLGKN